MPKSLAFGNGSVHLTIDRFARLRDFYFPYVGLENHIGGKYAHRVGVFVDNQFSWFDDGSWQIEINANNDFQGITTATSQRLNLTIKITDSLHNTTNRYIRKYECSSSDTRERVVKIFVNQQFELYQSEKGDTAYFDPNSHAIVHYEGRRAFVIGMKSPAAQFDDYSVGIFQIEGKEGTYKDAEDGMLSKNSIEHGRVDSVVATSVVMKDGAAPGVCYWICVAESIEGATSLHNTLAGSDPEIVMNEVAQFWNAWANRLHMRFYGLSEGVITLFNRSQLYLRAHVDKGGAIIASGDSEMLETGRDTYSYMWPRDAAYVSTALDWIGDRHNARKFFEFLKTVLSKDGYFMHKYRPDGSLGSSWHGWIVEGHPELPIQEDETALVLWALWEHWEASKDLDFIGSIYEEMIRPMASFMLSYRDAHSGLPKPSYNLWEEKFAVHTYTASAVTAALDVASKFASMLADHEFANECARVRDEIRAAILAHMIDENGEFIRSIYIHPDGTWTKDVTCDASSAYGVFIFGVLPPGDERLRNAISRARRRLSVETPAGGIMRYEYDQYYRRNPILKGNPWIITTLWFAQYDILTAASDHDLDVVRKTLNWVVQNATSSGILPEQFDPQTREHLSAAPLAWSHAEYIRTVMMYLKKVHEIGLV